MHIETLKTFCDLVETGSFNKAAAAQLHLAVRREPATEGARDSLQPSAARAPDAAGRRADRCRADLLRGVPGAARPLPRLEERLKERSATIAGTVRLATVYSVGLHELPPYVTRFMKAHPQVKVHVEYSRTDKVCEACLDGTIDFGIVAFPLRRSNVAVIPWHDEKLVLVCAPNHRLARRRKVSLAQLAGEAFIAFERDIPTRKTIDRLLKTHRVTVNTVMEFDNIETIKRSIEVGSGLSILPDTTVINEVKSGLLVTVDFAEGRFTRAVGVIHRRGRVLSAAAQEFVRLLVATT